jgi:hypothetical protein
MPTIQDSITLVRKLLRDPKAQQPDDFTVLKRILSKYQAFLNTMNNTGLAWATGEINLPVQQGKEDYEITQAGNFGKALLVATRDPSNPAHIERPIEIFNVENMDFNWLLPNDFAGYIAGWDGSNTTAMRMAFFRKQGFSSVFVRVKPIPQLSASYRVLYEIGDWTKTVGLGDELLLPEHHDLPLTRAAISLLPYSDWSSDKALDSVLRKELAMSLANDEQEYAALFNEHIRTVAEPTMSFRNMPSF